MTIGGKLIKLWKQEQADHAHAVKDWQRFYGYDESFIPSEIELAAFLMRKLRKQRSALKVAIKEIQTNGGSWYSVNEDLIRRLEKQL